MIINSKKWKIVLLLSFIFILIPLSFRPLAVKASDYSDLNGIKVAIYCNPVIDANLDSRIALQNMFSWMNATVENITALEIQNGELSNFNIFVMPGRSDGTSYYELRELGVNKILEFIRNGGNYFGICGGAMFAARNDVTLFSGSLLPVPGEPISPHINEMRINTQSREPSLSGMNESFSILFWGSLYFIPNENQPMTIIASYLVNNRPGMITYRFGLGAVFLSSPHGEFEENNNRDGTDEFDSNNDTDSEWDLLLKVSQWLVSIPKDNIIFISLVSINCVALGPGFIVILIQKRKGRK